MICFCGYNCCHYLGVAQVTFWEKWSYRTVNQTTNQGFIFGRTPLTLEKTSGNLAASICLFGIVDSKRKKILPCFCLLGTNHGYQNHGITTPNHHRTAGLLGHLAGGDFYLHVSCLLFYTSFIKSHIFPQM